MFLKAILNYLLLGSIFSYRISKYRGYRYGRNNFVSRSSSSGYNFTPNFCSWDKSICGVGTCSSDKKRNSYKCSCPRRLGFREYPNSVNGRCIAKCGENERKYCRATTFGGNLNYRFSFAGYLYTKCGCEKIVEETTPASTTTETTTVRSTTTPRLTIKTRSTTTAASTTTTPMSTTKTPQNDERLDVNLWDQSEIEASVPSGSGSGNWETNFWEEDTSEEDTSASIINQDSTTVMVPYVEKVSDNEEVTNGPLEENSSEMPTSNILIDTTDATEDLVIPNIRSATTTMSPSPSNDDQDDTDEEILDPMQKNQTPSDQPQEMQAYSTSYVIKPSEFPTVALVKMKTLYYEVSSGQGGVEENGRNQDEDEKPPNSFNDIYDLYPQSDSQPLDAYYENPTQFFSSLDSNTLNKNNERSVRHAKKRRRLDRKRAGQLIRILKAQRDLSKLDFLKYGLGF